MDEKYFAIATGKQGRTIGPFSSKHEPMMIVKNLSCMDGINEAFVVTLDDIERLSKCSSDTDIAYRANQAKIILGLPSDDTLSDTCSETHDGRTVKITCEWTTEDGDNRALTIFAKNADVSYDREILDVYHDAYGAVVDKRLGQRSFAITGVCA